MQDEPLRSRYADHLCRNEAFHLFLPGSRGHIAIQDTVESLAKDQNAQTICDMYHNDLWHVHHVYTGDLYRSLPRTLRAT